MIPDHSIIDSRIAVFKKDLVAITPIEVARKHILSGTCSILSDDAYWTLRSRIAAKYSLHPNNVLVVGSAKLGFSIAPRKRYRHFGETSDVDVVVLSEPLFDKLWESIHDYSEHGGLWDRAAKFKEYLFNGWIRPDKLPPEKSFEQALEWWKFFNELSASGEFSSIKVRGGIYRNWYFLESYLLRSISGCRDELIGG